MATRQRARRPIVDHPGSARLDLTDINSEFLLCRRGNTGHGWEWTGDYDLVESSRGRLIEATRLFTCFRCGAIKEQTFRLPSMEVAKAPKITYPPGYLATHRLHPIEVRKEFWERTR